MSNYKVKYKNDVLIIFFSDNTFGGCKTSLIDFCSRCVTTNLNTMVIHLVRMIRSLVTNAMTDKSLK